jgi:uncharacterized protein YbjT (DUF2867 family)
MLAGTRQARLAATTTASKPAPVLAPVRRCSDARAAARNHHRPNVRAAAALSLAQIPPEALAAGAVVVAGALAAVAVAVKGMDGGNAADATTTTANAANTAAPLPPPPPPRENAVLVLGSTGRLGRRIVERLLASGRVVVAAARSEARAADVLLAPKDKGGLAIAPGTRLSSGGALYLETSVDVTDPATLPPQLFEGVSQVVIALGGVVGRLPSGGFGYVDDMSPERVEAQGVPNVLRAIEAAGGLGKKDGKAASAPTVLPMATEADLARWDRLDDVIMGGASSSALVAVPEAGKDVVAWRGELVHEGGGFCGQRTQKLGPADWSAFDGVELRCRVPTLAGKATDADDSPSNLLPNNKVTFKLNVKTLDQEDVPEATYQASFDVDARGGWTTARVPWSDFVRVERAQAVLSPDDDGAAPLDPSQVSKVGLVYSRFAFNKARNPNHLPGAFELQIKGGVAGFKAPRPVVVAIGSAGVERNAIVGEDAARRAKEIPIVRLNPGGVLNHKLAAEAAVRESGLPYAVVRCTGLVEEEAFAPPPAAAPAAAAEGESATATPPPPPPPAPAPAPDAPVPYLEADQGDTLVGRITRDDAAAAVVAALESSEVVSKTFELRRADPVPTLRGAPRAMASERDWRRMFDRLARDEERVRAGLDPIPRPTPPPPPPSEETKKEVLADPVVQRAAARDRAARGAEVDRREQAEKKQQVEAGVVAAKEEGKEEAEAPAVEAEKEKEPVAAR